MAPYFRRIKSFTDVRTTDAGIDTVQFLEAAEGLVGIFDLLGGITFKTVKDDMNGNINKVRTRYNAAPEKSKTLEELVQNEQADKKNVATEGLLWLCRGLSFTCTALQIAQAKPGDELSTAFKAAYADTLRAHHNILMRGAFQLALGGCPYRADFYGKLAEDPNGASALSQDSVNDEMDKWLAALVVIVARMRAFYLTFGRKDRI